MGNRVIIHSGSSIADANRIFGEMVKLTRELLALTPDQVICSKGKVKRWADLADVWMSYFEEACEYSVLEMAIHKIYWGVYPEPMRSAYVPLVELVENELLSDGPAYRAWRHHISYRFAFSSMRDKGKSLVCYGSRPHSFIFHSYQNARFWYNVVYKRRKPGLIDPATASLHQMKAAKTHDRICAICEGFERAVNCLIPESKDWSDKQWLNDLHIRRALKKHYNKTYADFDPDFEILMSGLINKFYYNAPVHMAQLLELGDIPMAMVSKIWPVNTAAELEKLFLRAACQAQIAETRMQNGSSYRYGQHSYQKLRNSWLYKHMCNTVGCNAAHDEYTRKLKAKVMQVGMGI